MLEYPECHHLTLKHVIDHSLNRNLNDPPTALNVPDNRHLADLNSSVASTTHTFPTGLKAEFMDMDPPGTFDYIFVKGECKIVSCEVAAQDCDPVDKTIFGSDHFAIVAELII